MSADDLSLVRLGEARLAVHAAQCDECRASPLPLAAVARELARFPVALDPGPLSRRVLAALRPELARLASAWFWQRLGRTIAAALLPLPAILWLDALAFAAFYGWASTLLPGALVSYLLVSYGALVMLLFAATYAAIPLVLARDAWARTVAPMEAAT